MIAEADRRRDLLREQRGADRHAGAERLAERHQVRLEAKRGGVERPAGAAEAALHFVGDEQRAGAPRSALSIAAAVSRESGRTPPSPWIGSTMIAAVSLRDRGGDRRGVLSRHERHAGEQRLRTARDSARPTSPTARPSFGRGTSAEARRTSVRGVALRAPEAARELQARFDRFRAAVAEERARQAGEIGQPRGELGLQRMVEQVRRVQQRRRLLGNRRARGPDARGRARRRRSRRSDRGSASPSRVNSAQPLPGSKTTGARR